MNKFQTFCTQLQLDPLNASVSQGLEFLDMLRTQGLSYSVINTARSALSLIIQSGGVAFGELPDVSKYMKGIYNANPPQPRYVEIWDPDIVPKLLKKWSPA